MSFKELLESVDKYIEIKHAGIITGPYEVAWNRLAPRDSPLARSDRLRTSN